MNASRLFSLALLIPALQAQTAPCASLNDTNTNVNGAITATSLAGYDMRAWQFIPSTAVAAQSVEFFTGNTLATGAKFITIEIWSEDPSRTLPLARLSGGTWKISNPLGVGWQGANLDQVTVLLPSTPYWLVWHEPGSSRIPTEPGGTAIPAALKSSSAVAWTSQAASALKFRIFCGLLDQQGVVSFGTACAGSSSRLGTVFSNQPPMVGNANFQFEGTGFPSGVLAVIALGTNPGWPAIPVPGLPAGCMQNTDIFVDLFGTTGTGTVRGPTAAGHVPFPLPIPNFPALVGTFVAGQIAALDSGLSAPIPFVTSNALRVTVY